MIEQQENVCLLSGNITLDTVPEILEKLRPLIQSGVDTLDFSGTKVVDSSALGLIFSCQRQALANNLKIKLNKLPASLQSLASLYGVADQIAI